MEIDLLKLFSIIYYILEGLRNNILGGYYRVGRKRRDITNQKFGKLTALELDHVDSKYNSYWKCMCDCGNIKLVRVDHLTSGEVKSCGKCSHFYVDPFDKSRVKKDITNQVFGRLTVVEFVRIDNRGMSYWKCICDCGNEKIVARSNLIEGRTKSCGCLSDELRRSKIKRGKIMERKCKWIIRPGTNNTFWAFTPCKKGFNYLSKINKIEDIKSTYDNRQCPICGKPIECNIELLIDE